jgi:hypothetical protein
MACLQRLLKNLCVMYHGSSLGCAKVDSRPCTAPEAQCPDPHLSRVLPWPLPGSCDARADVRSCVCGVPIVVHCFGCAFWACGSGSHSHHNAAAAGPASPASASHTLLSPAQSNTSRSLNARPWQHAEGYRTSALRARAHLGLWPPTSLATMHVAPAAAPRAQQSGPGRQQGPGRGCGLRATAPSAFALRHRLPPWPLLPAPGSPFQPSRHAPPASQLVLRSSLAPEVRGHRLQAPPRRTSPPAGPADAPCGRAHLPAHRQPAEPRHAGRGGVRWARGWDMPAWIACSMCWDRCRDGAPGLRAERTILPQPRGGDQRFRAVALPRLLSSQGFCALHGGLQGQRAPLPGRAQQ